MMLGVAAGVITWSIAVRFVTGISNGVPGKLQDHPYYGIIKSEMMPHPNRPLCSASLITKKHVISLDACLARYKENKLKVQFGVVNWCQGIVIPDLDYEASIIDVKFEPAYMDHSSRLAIGFLANEMPEAIYPILLTFRKGDYMNSGLVSIPGYGGPKRLINHEFSCTFLLLGLTNMETFYGRHSSSIEACQAKGNYCSLLQGNDMDYADQGGPVIRDQSYHGFRSLKPKHHKLVGVSALSVPTRVMVIREISPLADWICNLTGIVKPKETPKHPRPVIVKPGNLTKALGEMKNITLQVKIREKSNGVSKVNRNEKSKVEAKEKKKKIKSTDKEERTVKIGGKPSTRKVEKTEKKVGENSTGKAENIKQQVGDNSTEKAENIKKKVGENLTGRAGVKSRGMPKVKSKEKLAGAPTEKKPELKLKAKFKKIM